MKKITVYQKPTCTTCRKVYKELQDADVNFDAVNYYVDPLSKTKLKELLKKMKMDPADLIRKKEDIYKKLELSKKKLTANEWVDLMVKYPDLIQRPIVEKGAKAILARPAEKIQDIL